MMAVLRQMVLLAILACAYGESATPAGYGSDPIITSCPSASQNEAINNMTFAEFESLIDGHRVGRFLPGFNRRGCGEDIFYHGFTPDPEIRADKPSWKAAAINRKKPEDTKINAAFCSPCNSIDIFAPAVPGAMAGMNLHPKMSWWMKKGTTSSFCQVQTCLRSRDKQRESHSWEAEFYPHGELDVDGYLWKLNHVTFRAKCGPMKKRTACVATAKEIWNPGKCYVKKQCTGLVQLKIRKFYVEKQQTKEGSKVKQDLIDKVRQDGHERWNGNYAPAHRFGSTPAQFRYDLEQWSSTDWIKTRATRWVECAEEGRQCKFKGKSRRVRFGAEGKVVAKVVKDQVNCTAAAFSTDPAPDEAKKCWTQEPYNTQGQQTLGAANSQIGVVSAASASGGDGAASDAPTHAPHMHQHMITQHLHQPEFSDRVSQPRLM